MTPAIVVIAYDRPSALKRLLDSLAQVDYASATEVPLLISIDGGDSAGRAEVVGAAEAFEWAFGPKRVVPQPENLGLVDHFWAAGRLSTDYDGILLLEDDLTLAPPAYRFASQALECYRSDPRIAGVCLYALWFNGYTQLPFRPLDDGFDAFFVQAPYLQSLCFTSAQWKRFDEWWQQAGSVQPSSALHPSFLKFREDEWLPALAAYLAEQGEYLCFPRSSLSVGWGEPGVHFPSSTDWFLAPVQVRGQEFKLPKLDDSWAVYDSFFEPAHKSVTRLAPFLPQVDFDVDLNATKKAENLEHDYVLTTRPSRRPLVEFGLRVQPLELNVIQNLPGNEIRLARLDDVDWGRWAGIEARRRLERLAWSKRRTSRRRGATQALARGINKVRHITEKFGPRVHQ